MIDFLLSVPGRCTQILNVVNAIAANYTTGRAAFIDVAISSRAAAATALSNTVWTAARAAALDGLAAVTANITTMLQRPPLNPVTTLTTPPTYSAAKKTSIMLIDGLDTTGLQSPGAGLYVVAINEVGRGNINFLALFEWVKPASGTRQYRITIDGSVFTGSIGGASSQMAATIIGAVGIDATAGAGNEVPSGIAFENIPFLSLFKVEFTNSVAGGQYFTMSRYRRTG
jgi:hypothetical protein